MKTDGNDSSDRISDIDVSGLIYLMGDLVNPADPLEERRRTLIGGLGEWIGADAWAWLRWDGATVEGWQSGMMSHEWARLQDSARESAEPCGGTARAGSVLRRFHGRLPRTGVTLFRHAGQPAFSPRESRLAMILLEEVDWLYLDRPAVTADDTIQLSPRQEEIATLLLQGMGRKQISDELALQENTLASHIREIYRKYRVRSHAAFLVAGRREISPDPATPA